MKKNNLLLFSLLAFLPSALMAQSVFLDQLQKDPEVTWIAFSDFEYSLEGERYFDAGALQVKGPIKQGSNLHTVQLAPKMINYSTETRKVLMKYLAQQMLNGSIAVSSASDKTFRRLSKEAVKKGLAELLTADGQMKKSALPDKMVVQQVWYYHRAKDQLQVATLGIKPIFIKATAGKKEAYAPFFLPYDLKAAPAPFELDNLRFTWAKTSYGLFHNIRDLKARKGNTTELLRTVFWNIKDRQPLPKVYSRRAWPGLPNDQYNQQARLLTREKVLEAISSKQDTIITFHSETYEERIKVITAPPFTFDDIHTLRFCQLWYYDEQLGRLCSTLKAVGPGLPVKDANGNLKYYAGWYYYHY